MKQIDLPQSTRPEPARERPTLSEVAQFILGVLLFAIVAGAMSWVAVKVWLEVLSSI